MRIISGSKRGMRLLSPKGRDTRPITDRVKESVFNIMMKWGLPADAVTADLFCGTGSMGLEALSRGARWVTFIDRDRRAVEILEQNIARADFVEQSRSICHNVLTLGAVVQEDLYDLVFVDPPYEMSTDCGPDTKVGDLMAKIELQVKEGAIVILRTHLRAFVPPSYGQLEQIDKREWGSMKVMFFRKQTPEKSIAQME
jgi:16S rRNA (guanine966-N2)-methyltransferase